MTTPFTRRQLLQAGAATAGAALGGQALAQAFAFTPNQRYPDPAVQILDPGFAKYRLYSSTIEQVATGRKGFHDDVPIEDVLYLRAEMKYVTVRTAEREYLVEESLTAMEREFSIRFARIHRSCLVAKAAIAGFEKGGDEGESGWLVKLKGISETLPVSRRQWASVKNLGST